MKRNSLKLLFVLAFTGFGTCVSAQMPQYFAMPTVGPTSDNTPASPINNSGNGFPSPASPANPASSAPTSSASPAAASTTAQTVASGVPVYDPTMDNHLKAPVFSDKTGLFGLPVARVEEALRFQGGKNHSYAFGKYSRMTFSAYLVTIFFDRERKVGGFLVEPRAPYKTIEPNARQYFMQTFLKDADLSKFAIIMASDRLEVKFAP